jgi:pyridoxine kinase
MGEVDAVLSGYLPTPEHVHAVGRIVRRMRHRRSFLFCCDPVLGDDPKGVYLDIHAATALRGDLVPLADVATPNRFELGWLTGQPTDTLPDAVAAARTLPCSNVFVTSAGRQNRQLTNLHVGATGVATCQVSALDVAPHGTGDLFAGLVLGHLLNGLGAAEAMARSARGVAVALAASAGQDELSIVPMLDEIAAAPAVPLDPL